MACATLFGPNQFPTGRPKSAPCRAIICREYSLSLMSRNFRKILMYVGSSSFSVYFQSDVCVCVCVCVRACMCVSVCEIEREPFSV